MVLITGGTFIMGDDAMTDSSPPHKVILDSYYVDKTEVTNAEYHKFCIDTNHRLPEFWGMEKYHCGPDFPDFPVAGVSWADAYAFAQWAGKRLPTEAEWEYAARGGLTDSNYPNGNKLTKEQAIYSPSKGTRPVGSYKPNGYGLFDMSGNVAEWTADRYGRDYYAKSPEKNPNGPGEGRFRVFRGGGWHSGPYCNHLSPDRGKELRII